MYSLLVEVYQFACDDHFICILPEELDFHTASRIAALHSVPTSEQCLRLRAPVTVTTCQRAVTRGNRTIISMFLSVCCRILHFLMRYELLLVKVYKLHLLMCVLKHVFSSLDSITEFHQPKCFDLYNS